MASVPGGQYSFFASGENVNVVFSPDGNNLPAPIAGEFNLEVITDGKVPSGIPTGYQGVAVLSDNGQTLTMAYGDYAVRVDRGGPHTIIGGSGNDTIYGGNGPELLIGGSGADLIFGGNGPDTIQGGSGSETIYGGNGGDVITGGSGADVIHGGNGRDTITGGSGPDTIYAGHGGDLIYGGTGPDVIYAGDGPDTIFGGSGPDTIYGGYHNHRGGDDDGHRGGDDDNHRDGDDDNHRRGYDSHREGDDDGHRGGAGILVHGGSGADLIVGGDGNDTVFGGTGADTIDGGGGDNLIYAGTGGTLIEDSRIQGHDTVVGFDQAHGDAITFAGATAAAVDQVVATATVKDGSTTISLPDGSSMTLVGITHIDSTFFHLPGPA
jgi:Ca2+-binding RTX toxin-like protein